MSFAKVISSIFAQLASGTPIYKISAPSFIHQPKSGLEMNKDQIFCNQNGLLSLDDIEATPDPLDRIAKLFVGIFNVHAEWKSDKPFNPVLGEFIDEICLVEEGNIKGNIEGGVGEVSKRTFTYQAEQISHHPPVSCFRITGPSFTLGPEWGIDGSKGFKPGFNHIEINFAECGVQIVLTSKKTGQPILTYTPPGLKLDPIFTGKRTAGYYGEIRVSDIASGIQFVGKIKKPFILKGDFFDAEGKLIDSVQGDFFNGVFLKSSQKLWAISAPHVQITTTVPDTISSDPLLSTTVWSKVFQAMRQDPPDFATADVEKGVVEEQARQAAKTATKTEFVSRYGFKLPPSLKTDDKN